MIVTLHSTDKIVTLHAGADGDVPARIWEGTTDSGIRVHAFITRIAVHKNAHAAQFERELQETRPLSRDLIGVYDTRMIL